MNRTTLRCIEDAISLAKERGDAIVGTSHLLAVLLNEKKGYLTRLMDLMGIARSDLQKYHALFYHKEIESEQQTASLGYSDACISIISGLKSYGLEAYPEHLFLEIVDHAPESVQFLFDEGLEIDALRLYVQRISPVSRNYSRAFRSSLEDSQAKPLTNENIDESGRKEGSQRVLSISQLPDDILYMQFLCKALIPFTHEIPNTFARLHLQLFEMEQALKKEKYTPAINLKNAFWQELHSFMEKTTLARLNELQERISLIEEIIPEEKLEKLRSMLQTKNNSHEDSFIKILGEMEDIFFSLKQSISPKDVLICKVNIFDQGYRDTVPIEPEQTLEDLQDRFKKKKYLSKNSSLFI